MNSCPDPWLTGRTDLRDEVGFNKRANVEIQTISVFDGGSTGIGGGGVAPPPPDSTRFLTQGIFIP